MVRRLSASPPVALRLAVSGRQGKRTKQLEEDKRWLEERRRRMEAMASDCQRERAATVIQRCVRRHHGRCRFVSRHLSPSPYAHRTCTARPRAVLWRNAGLTLRTAERAKRARRVVQGGPAMAATARAEGADAAPQGRLRAPWSGTRRHTRQGPRASKRWRDSERRGAWRADADQAGPSCCRGQSWELAAHVVLMYTGLPLLRSRPLGSSSCAARGECLGFQWDLPTLSTSAVMTVKSSDAAANSSAAVPPNRLLSGTCRLLSYASNSLLRSAMTCNPHHIHTARLRTRPSPPLESKRNDWLV